jgi:anti-sigma factor (TIGR02949 family)
MTEHQHSPHCQQLLGSLSDYIDGELQAELCAELEQHIKECDNCRIVVNTLRKTVELYQQTTIQTSMPEAVRERLFYRLHLENYLEKA